MDSKRLRAAIDWADLLPELLATIAGHLQKHGDIVRFRSVCRSWRYSTALFPQKLSPYFPLKGSFMGELPSRGVYDYMINATAIYLIRPHSDPTKAWLIAAQEPSPGNLILRHALTYKEFTNIADPNTYLQSFTTQIVARSYSHNRFCPLCNGVRILEKLSFVTESSSNQLVGLCNDKLVPPIIRQYVFRLDLSLSGGGDIMTSPAAQMDYDLTTCIDHVNFKGRVYAVNGYGHIFVVDAEELRLVQIASLEEDDLLVENYLVVSEGDLYVVRWWKGCKIYRLLVDEVGDNGEVLMEPVFDIGDRVFVLGLTFSFSISARDLCHPWKGNCIVYSRNTLPCCRCGCPPSCRGQHCLLQLGGDQNRLQKITKLKGYSDLFHPPSSDNVNEQGLTCQHQVQDEEKP